MINEEQVTVLLCFHITCLSQVQKYDKKNGIIITDAHEFQKAVLYSKTQLTQVFLRNLIFYVVFGEIIPSEQTTTTREQIFKSLPWKLEIYWEGSENGRQEVEIEEAKNKIRLNQGWAQFMETVGGMQILL